MDAQIASALIQGGATLATGGLAAWIVMYQVGRQGRDALRQTRHSEQLNLNLDVYRGMLDVVGKVSEASLAFTRILNRLQYMCLPDWVSQTPDGRVTIGPPSTGEELIEKHSELGIAIADAIILIEQWQIVDPRLDLFKDAFNSAAYEIRERWSDLFVTVGVRLPSALQSRAEVEAWRAPPREVCEAAIPACQALQDAVGLADSWISDFQTELQWLLLRELFPTRLPYRQAPDPRYFTLRLDKYDELKRRLAETPWGRETERIEADAARRVAESNAAASQA